MALFRVDYVGRGELGERQQKLNQFLSKLTHVAEGVDAVPLTKYIACLHVQSSMLRFS